MYITSALAIHMDGYNVLKLGKEWNRTGYSVPLFSSFHDFPYTLKTLILGIPNPKFKFYGKSQGDS